MARTDAALVVADAGPLIHLDELGALDVLSDFEQVKLPEAVWLEVQRHRPGALSHTGVRWARTAVDIQQPRVSAISAIYTLHRGEQEALSLCLQEGINVLLTDDTAARLAALSLQLTSHGTLGLLLRAARMGTRTPAQVLALLQDIPGRSTLHLRPSLLAEIVQQVRTAWNL